MAGLRLCVLAPVVPLAEVIGFGCAGPLVLSCFVVRRGRYHLSPAANGESHMT